MTSSERVVVVAGATGALGSATVMRFAGDGWTVIGLARPGSLERVPAGATPVACDIAKAADVAALPQKVAEHGRWQALAVCSGGFAMGRGLTADDGRIGAQLELNLLGPWRLARTAATTMRQAGGGSIVVALSRASVEVAAGVAAYQVSKAAAARLVEVMALELRDDRITVNGVLPSVMDTPSNRSAMGEAGAGAWVPPARVAGVIAWLCSAEAADVSGALLPVYGLA